MNDSLLFKASSFPNKQVENKVKDKEKQTRIVETPNQEVSPRGIGSISESTGNDNRQARDDAMCLEIGEQLAVSNISSLWIVQRIVCFGVNRRNPIEQTD